MGDLSILPPKCTYSAKSFNASIVAFFAILLVSGDAVSKSVATASWECDKCELLKNKEVNRIYASGPSLLYAAYAFAPDKIIGLNFPFWDIEKIFKRGVL